MSEVVLSAVDEQIPSNDDSEFAVTERVFPLEVQEQRSFHEEEHDGVLVSEVHHEREDEDEQVLQDVLNSSNQVFVTTSDGYLSAEPLQDGSLKTTHILIQHGESLDDGLKTPATPITPATPGSITRYQWDESVHLPVLPVRCKNTNGELHKNKFGSGGRGRCIKMGDNWYTPSEFEAVSGRASSKDWKRSIRYGGRTVQCLIEEGLLQPHATSCTCAACCDDENVTGPVRLFTPYKRRKRDSTGEFLNPNTAKTKPPPTLSKTTLEQAQATIGKVLLISPATQTQAEGQTIHVVTANGDDFTNSTTNSYIEATTATDDQDTVILAPLTKSPEPISRQIEPFTPDEMRIWWQLDEAASSLVEQAKLLKQLIVQSKQEILDAKKKAIEDLKSQLESARKETLRTARIEAQMHVSRAVMEARAEKDIAMQQALARARAAQATDKIDGLNEDNSQNKPDTLLPKQCANCNRDSYLECTGCRRVSYCSSFCQQKDWLSHQSSCHITEEEELDSDRDK